MKIYSTPAMHGFVTAIAACAIAAATPAQAANHALIMTVDYAGTHAMLPAAGIEADGNMAYAMARAMGVPDGNIQRLRNGNLGLAGMAAVIDDLARRRIRDGDKVFIYYSGHGTQIVNRSGGGGKCSEAMVAADLEPYADDKLEAALAMLASKASQVVMMNDSCFSGGQATKSLDRGLGDGAVAKVFYPSKAGSASDTDYVCNKPVNKSPMERSLEVVGRQTSTRMLYLAASADNEVSWATPRGSTATLAWSQCLQSRQADRDNSSIIDGDELRKCAQQVIERAGGQRQTITLVGERRLPLSFTEQTGSGNAPVGNPRSALESLRAAADPTISVELSVANPRLKIDQDLLDFTVRTERKAYMYLLHIGTDGKFYQLFPNGRDRNNYLDAGVHRFPRSSWGIRAHGPAGTGYFMAYVSDIPRDFAKDMGADGDFAVTDATEGGVKSLITVGLNARHGTSAVVAISEVN